MAKTTEIINLDLNEVRTSRCPCCLTQSSGDPDIVAQASSRVAPTRPRRWVWRLCSRCAKRELAREPGESKSQRQGRARAAAIVQWAIGLRVDVEDVLGQAARTIGKRYQRLLKETPTDRRRRLLLRARAIAVFRKRISDGMTVEQASEGLTDPDREAYPPFIRPEVSFGTADSLSKAARRTK